VFRYDLKDDTGQEDWLNDVVPALMIFSFLLLGQKDRNPLFHIGCQRCDADRSERSGGSCGHPSGEGRRISAVRPN